jgi:hypothetical protein
VSIRQAVKNYRLLEVENDSADEVCYGCRQEWYSTSWKRVAGCGPSVVSTIINYVTRARETARAPEGPPARASIDEMRKLMDDVWAYVTPTIRGIPNTRILREGIERYVERNCAGFDIRELAVPKRREMRPPLAEIVAFLTDALAADVPAAFLALDSGDEKRLDAWHWVTLVSVEYEPDMSAVSVEVIDECRLFEANLLRWYATTSAGGGFVSLRPR